MPLSGLASILSSSVVDSSSILSFKVLIAIVCNESKESHSCNSVLVPLYDLASRYPFEFFFQVSKSPVREIMKKKTKRIDAIQR